MRGLARIARVEPIDVPSLGEPEAQAEAEGLARRDRIGLGDERHLGVRRLDRHALARLRDGHAVERESQEKQCQESSHHPLRSRRP